MWRPSLRRTLAPARSCQAPLRVAAARRASPIQSGAVALGEDGRKRNPAAWALRACVCSHATAPRGFGTHSHTPMCFDTGHRQTMCLPCIRITQLTGILHPQARSRRSARSSRGRAELFLSAPLCRTPENALRGEPASYIRPGPRNTRIRRRSQRAVSASPSRMACSIRAVYTPGTDSPSKARSSHGVALLGTSS